MKKTLYHIGVIAATALAFVACNKEVEINQPQGEVTHVATITLGKAVDTRTAVVEEETEAYYKWLETDTQYLHVYENGNEGTITDFILSENNTVATLTVSFSGTPDAPYTYTAKYFSQESNAHNPLIIPEQKPKVDNFDPAADILISKEIVSESERLSNLKFTMGRVVTVNKMTLTGLASGEKVSKVEFTLDKYMSSYYKGPNDYSSNKTKLTLSFEDNPATVPADGKVPVYFISAPVDAAGIVSVVVTTDQNVYTKTNELDPNPFAGKTITFAIGKMMRFNMAMSGYGEPISTGTEYHLVNSNDDIYSGATYLIVGGETYALGEQKTNNRGAISVTDNNGVITIDNTFDVYPVIIETTAGGYTILDTRNNGYLYPNSTSANQLKIQNTANENTVWTIAIEDGVASINNVKNTSRGQMRFNPNNGSPLFASYATNSTTGDPALALYVDPNTCVVNPRIIVTPTVIDNVSYKGVTDATNLTFELKDLTGNATATCDGTIVTSAGVVGNSVKYSVSSNTGEARSGWIRIAVGEVYAEVAVNQTAVPTLDFNSIHDLNVLAGELDNNGTATYSGKLTNAVVSFVPDTKNAIVKDETGSILVFKDEHSLLQGQSFSGEIEVTVKMYYTTIEITALDASFTGEQTVVEPDNMTLESLVGNFDSYQNTYVKVEDLTVTNRDGKNISVSNGDNTYVVYDSEGSSTASTGDIISVIGTVADHNGTNQIKAWNSSSITITSVAPKAITFSQPSTGGSFTVSVGGSNITSGTTVASGTTVTLTATPATNYTFNGWTVNGATVADPTAATTTFTMGSSSVSISASFTSNTGGTTTYTKVTSAPSDWSGTYILVYESSATSGLVCLAGTDAYQNYTTATISSGVISSNDLTDYEVDITSYSTGYSIKALGGANANKYLEGKGSSNGTTFATSASKVTTFSLSNGAVTITNNTNLFVYNSTSGTNGERWRFYKSGTAAGDAYKKPALYKKN